MAARISTAVATAVVPAITTAVVPVVTRAVVGACDTILLMHNIHVSAEELADRFEVVRLSEDDSFADAHPRSAPRSRCAAATRSASSISGARRPVPPSGTSHQAMDDKKDVEAGLASRGSRRDAAARRAASRGTTSRRAAVADLLPPLPDPVYPPPSADFVMSRRSANFYLVTKGFRTGVMRTLAHVQLVADRCEGAVSCKMSYEEAVAEYDRALADGRVVLVPYTLANLR
jgi:hypothetical protein